MTAAASRLPALPADLPDAKLPVVYETAKSALAACERIDECAEWASKAEALASYAKQAKDTALRDMADRIQARAVRRMGELLAEIEPRPGFRSDLQPSATGGTRSAVARAAGLSPRKQARAVAVARLPEADFEAAVESAKPPTVTQLAQRGTKPRSGRSPTPNFRRSPVRPLPERMESALDQLDTAVEVLTRWLAEPAARAHRQCHGWLQRLARARASLSKILNTHRRRS